MLSNIPIELPYLSELAKSNTLFTPHVGLFPILLLSLYYLILDFGIGVIKFIKNS
jgi:hypothetical protein